MRFRFALLAAVALLAACTSSTISGSGSMAAGIPKGVVRIPQQSSLGDLVTVDLCHGISMSAFHRFGFARVHGWQTASTCYIDIYLGHTRYLQLNTWAEQSSEFDNTGGSPNGLADGSGDLFRFSVRGTDCERALEMGSVVLETHTYNVHGSVPTHVLCAAASTLVRQQIRAFSHSRVPDRSLARPSLTRFDICALAQEGDYHSIPGLERATTLSFLEGAGCTVDALSMYLSVRIAFIALDFPLIGRDVTVRGHRLRASHLGNSCELVSIQHTTADGQEHEILDVQANGHGPTSQPCRTAERLAAVMLGVAHLD